MSAPVTDEADLLDQGDDEVQVGMGPAD